MRDEGSGTGFCSGTLIHPDVVMLAAHCIDPEENDWLVGSVGLGESGWLPERSVQVTECQMHPEYDRTDQHLDLAWCRLAEPVTDVPIVPLLMGCEVETLGAGDVVTIVGFGATEGIYDGDGGVDISGQGTKRYTEMVIEELDLEENDLLLLGDDTGACFGDSGGPAFVSLPEGGWRVIGAASTVHPDTQYMEGDDVCIHGSVYELGFTQAKWIEDSSGIDVTPCHDPDGTWDPGADCREFPLEPWLDDGKWPEGCAAGANTDWVSTCGLPYPDDSGTGGAEDPGSGLVGRGCGCRVDDEVPWPTPSSFALVLLWFRRRR
jgi:hypothetical protein